MELISREAAIEALKRAEALTRAFGYHNVIETIRELPTIDPVKHGRWSREHLLSTSGGTYEVWRCSECQSHFNWRMRFCGHCGARMEGEEG